MMRDLIIFAILAAVLVAGWAFVSHVVGQEKDDVPSVVRIAWANEHWMYAESISALGERRKVYFKPSSVAILRLVEKDVLGVPALRVAHGSREFRLDFQTVERARLGAQKIIEPYKKEGS